MFKCLEYTYSSCLNKGVNYLYDLTLQQAVLAERSARLQRDAERARLRRLLRLRSGRRFEHAPSGPPDIAPREHAVEANVVTLIEPRRHRAA